ncbi:MAG: HlyD family efflux transporter periplasmic adaptor subunit [Defluviitaleaceae bacterium]|nr:HlyD family efflux transporter periplasmic adaptor subunit [Defluviitaleaceae bacterium]
MKIDKKKMRKMLYIYIVIMLVLVFSSRTIYNFSLPRVTVALAQSGVIVQELEARGVVEFYETFDIFAPSSGWIDYISIRPEDLIDENTILARYTLDVATAAQTIVTLQTNIARAENQLQRLIMNRADIQNSLDILSLESPTDTPQHQWAIEDAMTDITNLQTTQAHALATAQREWNSLMSELYQAQAALLALEPENPFDDFMYQRNIQEAAIVLERSMIDLETAETNLADARRARSATFDTHYYQSAINTARTAHERSITAYEEAHSRLETALQHLNYLTSINASQTEINTAQTAVNTAQSQLTTARQTRDDNSTALQQSQENLTRARTAFNTQDREDRDQNIIEAEAQLTQAQNTVSDAIRAHENAIEDATRAENQAETNATHQFEEAQREALERIQAAQRALDENDWTAQENLYQQSTNFSAAIQALQRAEENQALAITDATIQHINDMQSLGLQLRNIDIDIASTQIDLGADQNALTVATAYGAVYVQTPRQGRVISVDKRVGEFITQGARIAEIGVANNRFMIEFTSTIQEAGFIEVGDTANIYKSGGHRGISATVQRMTPTGDTLTIRLYVETDALEGGEFARIHFRTSNAHHMVVPNEAVFVGAAGQHYIWNLRSRHTSLGMEYYTARVSVRILASDDFNVAIYAGWFSMDMPVVTSYSRQLSVNGRVSRME